MIGHHLLEGKVVNLPKPLAVLLKRANLTHKQRENTPGHGNGTAESNDGAGDGGTEYDIVAVVKRKLLFSKRPMPIVGTFSGGNQLAIDSGSLSKPTAKAKR